MDGKLKQKKLMKHTSKHSFMILKTFTTTHQDQATLEALISLTLTKLSKNGETQFKLIKTLAMIL